MPKGRTMLSTTTRSRSTALAALAAGAFASAALAAPAAARTVLFSGHVDAVAARIDGGRLISTLKDSTGGRTVWRDPSTVTIRVVSKARTTVPAGLGVVGRKGSPVWLIPQVQRSGVIWAGWNTEAVGSAQVRGAIRWTVSRVSGPGKLVVFQSGSFGEADVLFNSGARLPQGISIPLGTHAHGNWAFTKPGTYTVAYRLSARSVSGTPLGDSSTLTFSVG
ncbi:TIGR03773 family transporter-associated surface protein [Conexibacter stalactiti]|uniref:TIGR03773 family transporter-associated surface protein n=1 Tax=Conexibacter stalactiti TaxID=1940611 RepID=A0ABU4I297_9ACTN|nr:TIGR03773 family transporter-associated surface protein [Conexibacter stalactiti]MDW5598820.1 TIGR03773 family transporter-associated surface protein [Conexibacter stalactiti]MEC5039462.1 TIGR03773 family transporter-associated surface protein [Conexibacter stalactiti]